jgi:hypothetical protein
MDTQRDILGSELNHDSSAEAGMPGSPGACPDLGYKDPRFKGPTA